MHTGRANGGEQGEEKGKNKGRIRMRPYANSLLKLRTRLERKGNWTKLQRVHISLSRLLALHHRQHLSSRPLLLIRANRPRAERSLMVGEGMLLYQIGEVLKRAIVRSGYCSSKMCLCGTLTLWGGRATPARCCLTKEFSLLNNGSSAALFQGQRKICEKPTHNCTFNLYFIFCS